MEPDLSAEQAAVLGRVDAERVEGVRAIFLDYNGIPRARSLAPDSLPSAFRRGVNFSSPTVDFNSRDLFPADAVFDLASPDVWAVPDATTYRPAPATASAAEMLADLVDEEGEPWSGCPRTALRRVVERAAGMGVEFQLGFEPEGFLVRPSHGELEFVGAPQFATLDGLDVAPEFRRELLAYLAEAGIEVLQWSEEYGPGQIEVNLRHGPALRSADTLVSFKHAFRAIARSHDLLGTFMPKPFAEVAGSGLHVHISAVSPGEPDVNLFDDPRDAVLGLSALGRHALAGLLRHGGALTALGAATGNRYT